MRKVALLLASLGIVAAAYAEQPKLEVTHVGQEIYIENQAGNQDLDEVSLFNNVGLKYGDWTFGLQAGKQWAVNYGDDHDITSSNAQSANRIQIDAWNKVTDDLRLGFRWRGTKGYDRFYARYDWKHGMLWSAGDMWYQAENETNDQSSAGHDSLQFEVFPIGLQYGPFKAGYFVNYVKYMGDIKVGQQDEYWEHQVRAYATLYKGEKLTVTTQARITFAADAEYNGKAPHRAYDDFGGRNRIYLGANYKYTDNLSLYVDYGYEFRDFKYEDGLTEAAQSAKDRSANNYQEITIGWKYTF